MVTKRYINRARVEPLLEEIKYQRLNGSQKYTIYLYLER